MVCSTFALQQSLKSTWQPLLSPSNFNQGNLHFSGRTTMLLLVNGNYSSGALLLLLALSLWVAWESWDQTETPYSGFELGVWKSYLDMQTSVSHLFCSNRCQLSIGVDELQGNTLCFFNKKPKQAYKSKRSPFHQSTYKPNWIMKSILMWAYLSLMSGVHLYGSLSCLYAELNWLRSRRHAKPHINTYYYVVCPQHKGKVI